jgi:hypothetical protein
VVKRKKGVHDRDGTWIYEKCDDDRRERIKKQIFSASAMRGEAAPNAHLAEADQTFIPRLRPRLERPSNVLQSNDTIPSAQLVHRR